MKTSAKTPKKPDIDEILRNLVKPDASPIINPNTGEQFTSGTALIAFIADLTGTTLFQARRILIELIDARKRQRESRHVAGETLEISDSGVAKRSYQKVEAVNPHREFINTATNAEISTAIKRGKVSKTHIANRFA